MCKELLIWKEVDDCLLEDLGELNIADTPVLCTCWLGAEPTDAISQDELDQLNSWFMAKLGPFLRDPRMGEIIIEAF